MNVEHRPILRELRALYDLQGVWPRFNAYVKLMVHGPERLPLGAFSPMGQRQAEYLDGLLSLDAEGVATQAARDFEQQTSALSGSLRSMLIVTDEPRNGWTQRWLTDAEWRFGAGDGQADGSSSGRWVSVQLWTDHEASADYVRQEVSSALYRAAHQQRFGRPLSLRDMLRQEGRALTFAGQRTIFEVDELAYSGAVLEPLLGSTHYPTCFAALYGDDIARAVGYPALGLSPHAGFEWALFQNGLHQAEQTGDLLAPLRPLPSEENA